VEGNSVVPRGLFYWNGATWRQLSIVCGGTGDTTRIAWAGPTEFWTISAPSRPRIGDGISLCRFKDGEVVVSFGTQPQDPDPFRQMNAAECNGPNDCWFGGPGSSDPTGARTGAFRLHWDGKKLTTHYGPQGRAITDLEFHAGRFHESVLVGRARESQAGPVNTEPEVDPLLLHQFVDGSFASLPFLPLPVPGVPANGSELLALDGDGTRLWAVGGGAASGPAAPRDGMVRRLPLAAVDPGSGMAEIPLVFSDSSIGSSDRFVDVAAVPGTTTAWVAVQAFADRATVNAPGMVARIDSATGRVEAQRLPASGPGRGTAARIDCPAVGECWMVTKGGWLFHYTDGTPLPIDRDPAFEGLISFRPNEAAAQFVPDTPPVDDSQLFRPAPVKPLPKPPSKPKVIRLKPVLTSVRSKMSGLNLTISFRVNRRANVGVLARRGNAVVARAGFRWLRPGNRSLTLYLKRDRWPTKLSFSVREPKRSTR